MIQLLCYRATIPAELDDPVIFTALPLASADSTNVARNIGIDAAWRGTYRPRSKDLRAAILVERIEAANGACRLFPATR